MVKACGWLSLPLMLLRYFTNRVYSPGERLEKMALGETPFSIHWSLASFRMDYKKYAAVDRTALLEVLISRGMYQQAMSIVSQFGYEGIRIESQLKLTSRMLTRCEMEEDDELLALASDVYRRGKYDEVILKYLMEYRFGPVDELISVWKSAQGFELDTYELEEKLLGLLMFTSDYRKEGLTAGM